MKRLYFVFLYLIGFYILAGQKTEANFSALKIDDSLYVDQTEVTVGDYYAMIHELVNLKKDYKHLLPDSSVLSIEIARIFSSENLCSHEASQYGISFKVLSGNKNIQIKLTGSESMYTYAQFIKPELFNYPISGISYEQAEAYCAWRSKTINTNYVFEEHIVCRLLSSDEWKKICTDGNWTTKRKGIIDMEASEKYQQSMEEGRDSETGYVSYNYNFDARCSKDSMLLQLNSFGNKLMKGTQFSPNFKGFYDFYGNVAEMVKDKGLAKGGSYYHNPKECQPDNTIYYNKPENWLGFRCLLVLK